MTYRTIVASGKTFLFLFVALCSTQVFAVTYAPLSVDLPLVKDYSSLPDYINAIIGWSVGLASALAVIMLVVGGFNYMTSESVFRTGDAKEKITNAIVGLFIVLGAVMLLGYINPDLIKMSLIFK
jgi:hypothetical protein